MSRTVLAIDIGSTKICAIIAEIDNDNSISITGAGVSKAQGLKKGSITNIELASRSIKSALNDAKRVSGSEVKTAIVSISGAYTKSLNSSGIVNIQNKEVSFKEIERVMQTSLYNANIPNEYEVLHALPYNFKVDDQDFIEDPLGMNASRLEVDTHIITTQKSNLNNLKKAVRGAGVEVENIVLTGYASSIATLNDDEKELGVALIDMGGNTSNIIIHSGNSLRYNDFLGVGSNHVTSDLSMALHTPLNIADSVKLNYGSLLTPSNDLIELPIIGDEYTTHEVSLEVVHNVVYARVEETLMILAQFIENSGLKDKIGAGVVLTGGFSQMEGIRELAVATFGSIPVRLAKPKEMYGLFDNLRSPEYSSAVGLVMYAASPYTQYEIDVNKRVRHSNEVFTEQSTINLTEEQDIPTPQLHNEKKVGMISIGLKKEKKSDEAGAFSKFWNWATQLF
ncbi:MAG: cell division protein FtsA [Sulfurimonas sp. RIFCSPHIGHO2_12_FULL_36_9]|uniref:cell division protein FtsA n=1 Tax=Sulfurimonas sp. RIFCSPLOWO2_12_36_12 TaxID=1802253 RepID=UPI0008D5C185|nr:cell division protein FtsA [Sulfurimonas sp. RIFCSPLOWO2_12_36_12]OHD98611.1 MAG: cell division protein FtsA [Sulfurimonas sp. RIFCSPLOWO2_02_FULL_36_28]OHD99292.1 MAG: cell division protein FtsA [Sulfurimonas sp. RIFCSPHIGHO2_12_FULL_36_9]OHE01505.1 MAG: cell division protein FtsA [Sulfurimonas sp. RIFCSPLOWO2_12_36_12]OHE04369.1 MAG: cell division protein FtsA [Sulfurimonas sp. RIFCSPLOWO2_12_FULL_36_74]